MIFGHAYGVIIAAVVVGTLAAARVTRLVVNDSWPPVKRLRDAWSTWTAKTEKRSEWWLLLNCPWCFGPWATLVIGGVAVLSDLAWWWWAGAGWFAASYVASWLVFHDEDSRGSE